MADLKVLHVIDGLGVGGGAEESLVEMLPLLRERGIDGSVVCLYDRAGHEARLRATGFDVTVLNARGILQAIPGVRRQIRAEQPDLIHATLIDATFATRLARIGLRPPELDSLVNTTYDPIRVRATGISTYKLNLIKSLDRLTSRSVNHFHALTGAVAQETESELLIPRERITIIPRGRGADRVGLNSPERRLRVRTALSLTPDTPLILNVGRRSPQKDKTTLLRAMPEVLRQFPTATLLIAGRPGPSDQEINSLIDELGIGSSVMVLGHRSDIGDLLCASDVFVLPSLFEGLGGSAIEAMAAGCPIIAADAPALVEVLADGAFGRITPRRDVSRLASAIVDSLTDQATSSRLAAAAYTRYKSTYDIDAVVEQMARMYRSLARPTRAAEVPS